MFRNGQIHLLIHKYWNELISRNNSEQMHNQWQLYVKRFIYWSISVQVYETKLIRLSQGNKTVASRWKWHFVGHFSITLIAKTLSKIKIVPFLAAFDTSSMRIWNLIFRIHCQAIQIKYPITSSIECSWFQIFVYTS